MFFFRGVAGLAGKSVGLPANSWVVHKSLEVRGRSELGFPRVSFSVHGRWGTV